MMTPRSSAPAQTRCRSVVAACHAIRGGSAALLLLLAVAASVLPGGSSAEECNSGILQLQPGWSYPEYCARAPLDVISIHTFCSSALRVRVKDGIVKVVPLDQNTYTYNDFNADDPGTMRRFNCKDVNSSGTMGAPYPGFAIEASVMLYTNVGGAHSVFNKTAANEITYWLIGKPENEIICFLEYRVVQGCVFGIKAPAKPPPTCPAGFTKAIGRFNTSICTPCPGGTFSPKPGHPCKPCPAGTYTSARAQAVEPTFGGVPDRDGAFGATTCTKCPPGRFSSRPGQTDCGYCNDSLDEWTDGKSGCRTCPAGSIVAQPGRDGCVRCRAGKRCCTAGWGKDCPKCTGGTPPQAVYASIFALESATPSSCLSTPHALCAPKINITIDDGSCGVSISNMRFNAKIDDVGTKCPWDSGSVQFSGAHLTATGLQMFGEDDTPSLLAANFSTTGPHLTAYIPTTKCTLRYRALTAPAAKLLGMPPKPGKTTTCPAGHYLETKTDIKPAPCLPCPLGTYSPAPSSNTRCTICPAGTFAKGYGATKCSKCPASRVAPKPGTAWCGLCGKAHYPVPGGKSCAACPKNSVAYYPGATGRCLGNDYGNVCCAAGNCKGQAPCKPKQVGKSETYTAVLKLVSKSLPQPACKDALSLTCLGPEGKLLLSYTPSQSDRPLQITAYGPLGPLCKDADYAGVLLEGGYTDQKHAYVKRLTYDDAESSKFAYGLVSNSSTRTVTIYTSPILEDVKVPLAPPKARVACSATFKLVNGRAFDLTTPVKAKCGTEETAVKHGGYVFCQPCGKGSFKNSKGGCSPCPRGYYNDIIGATACKVCPAGHLCASEGTTFLQWCSAGTYANAAKPAQATDCKQCPANTYSLGGTLDGAATKCTPCPKGTFAPVESSQCGVPWDLAFPA